MECFLSPSVLLISLLFLSGYRLHLRQQVTELPIVDLHAVVEVKADALIGIVAQFFIEGLQFGLLLDELISFLLLFAAV